MPVDREQTRFEPDKPNIIDGSMVEEKQVSQRSLVFYRVDTDFGRPSDKRLYAILGDFNGKTISELQRLHGKRYDYFILHDSIDRCLVVGTEKGGSTEISVFPCKTHHRDED